MTTCAPDVRSKEIQCDIQKNRMSLSVRGDTVAAGEFYGPVDSSESIWELGKLSSSLLAQEVDSILGSICWQ